jgi:hypothetical protein
MANRRRNREIKMPGGLEFWTADECAECLVISNDLSNKLWGFLSDAKNPTPLGGDPGEQPGTVETPEEQLDLDNDDKADHWWDKLTKAEQKELRDAFLKDHPDLDYDLDPEPN